MRNSKIVKFDGAEVTVKELTVGEFELLFSDSERERTMLDRLLDKEMMTGEMMSMATGIPTDKLKGMTISCMRPLIDAFKEVAPDFFETARLETERAEKISKALGEALEGALVS